MGQYYLAVNLDRKEFVSPHDYDNGAKLMEHSYVGNSFLGVVEKLLSPGQPWHKTRLVWAGDYMDEGLFVEPFGVKGELRSFFPETNTTLYQFADNYFKSLDAELSFDDDLRYIVNHTKQQYCDKLNTSTDQSYPIHPISLLTSSGNGRGGGDFSDTSNTYVGSWAADVISMEKEIPANFTEIVPNFVEH